MNVAAKLGDGDPNAELLFEVLRVAVKVRTGRDFRWESPLGAGCFSSVGRSLAGASAEGDEFFVIIYKSDK